MSMTPTQRVEILRASCCIAGADGETTDDELVHIKKLAAGVGVGQASLQAMMERAERDPEFYKQQFNILKAEPMACLEVLIKVTVANGQIKEEEFNVLKGLATQLGITEEQFKEKVQHTLQSLG